MRHPQNQLIASRCIFNGAVSRYRKWSDDWPWVQFNHLAAPASLASGHTKYLRRPHLPVSPSDSIGNFLTLVQSKMSPPAMIVSLLSDFHIVVTTINIIFFKWLGILVFYLFCFQIVPKIISCWMLLVASSPYVQQVRCDRVASPEETVAPSVGRFGGSARRVHSFESSPTEFIPQRYRNAVY